MNINNIALSGGKNGGGLCQVFMSYLPTPRLLEMDMLWTLGFASWYSVRPYQQRALERHREAQQRRWLLFLDLPVSVTSPLETQRHSLAGRSHCNLALSKEA